MKPTQTATINGTLIQEFFVAGEMLCLVNGKPSKATFEDEVRKHESKEGK